MQANAITIMVAMIIVTIVVSGIIAIIRIIRQSFVTNSIVRFDPCLTHYQNKDHCRSHPHDQYCHNNAPTATAVSPTIELANHSLKCHLEPQILHILQR